jgi:hypothetical protein
MINLINIKLSESSSLREFIFKKDTPNMSGYKIGYTIKRRMIFIIIGGLKIKG